MPKNIIEIAVVNGVPQETFEQARRRKFNEQLVRENIAHNKLYDTTRSWPGQRTLKTSLGDFIKQKG